MSYHSSEQYGGEYGYGSGGHTDLHSSFENGLSYYMSTTPGAYEGNSGINFYFSGVDTSDSTNGKSGDCYNSTDSTENIRENKPSFGTSDEVKSTESSK